MKEIKGSKIKVERNGHIITRNSSFFRKVPQALAKDEEDEGTEILGPRNGVVPEQPQQGEVVPEQPQQGDAQLMVRRSARNRKHTEHYGQVIDSANIS